MGKASHGDYAAYETPGGLRFQHKSKLVSVNAVPPEVVELLKKKVAENTPQVAEPPKQRFPRPSEEELARMREESLRVTNPDLIASPEKLAEDAAALTENDFDVPELPPADEPAAREQAVEAMTEPSAEQMHSVSQALDSTGQAPLPRAVESVRPAESDFLEQVSIHSAPLEAIVQALSDRFGIYTVHLGRLPEADEINPLTAEQFSKYHLGIAYQAAIKAANTGVLDRKPEEGRRLIDEGRQASENFQVDQRPMTVGEARRANSFEYRTSVRGMNDDGAAQNNANVRYDDDEDELIVEPKFGQQVIRPDW